MRSQLPNQSQSITNKGYCNHEALNQHSLLGFTFIFSILIFHSCTPRSDKTNKSVFYVCASGDDSKNGLSPENAWRKVQKVSKHDFSPGDSILFNGGDEFGAIEYIQLMILKIINQ